MLHEREVEDQESAGAGVLQEASEGVWGGGVQAEVFPEDRRQAQDGEQGGKAFFRYRSEKRNQKSVSSVFSTLLSLFGS